MAISLLKKYRLIQILQIKNNLYSDWIVVKALEYGIGIHHGLVPKYIQKEIINFFNNGTLKILFSTTTITEGVNTSTKNLIVFDSKKDKKDLKKFDAKNIEGRAGRFMHHFSGSVFVIDEEFKEIINSENIGIRHKNYDENSSKDEVDYFITDNGYLNKKELTLKRDIFKQIDDRQIPPEIINAYKIVCYSDKIKLFDILNRLSLDDNKKIKSLIAKINTNEQDIKIDFDGFDFILRIMSPIIRNQNLKNLMNNKSKKTSYNLTYLIYYYLKGGFKGLVDYKVNKKNISVDKAMQESSRLVFNTLKYELVKYLGVFNQSKYAIIISIKT